MSSKERINADTPDRVVFKNCFQEYFEGLHRYAYTIIKDNELAKDIVQTVFTKCWEKREFLKIESSIKSYLYKAVYNQSLNHLRNTKNRKTYAVDFGQHPIDVAEELMPDPQGAKEMEIKLKKAIEGLPPQCQLIFRKSRFEEKKYAEIATELNLSVKTIEVQIGKALRILRSVLINHNKIATLYLFLHLVSMR